MGTYEGENVPLMFIMVVGFRNGLEFRVAEAAWQTINSEGFGGWTWWNAFGRPIEVLLRLL